MQIKKETEVAGGGTPTAVQLEAINAQAKGKLTAEQVYVFSLPASSRSCAMARGRAA